MPCFRIKDKVLRFIRRHRLIGPGHKIILGVSGGPDSVVLAHIMRGLAPDLSISLHIAHLNHCLRPTSDRDQKCVEQLAARLNVPITVRRQRKGIIKKKISEDQSRKWRYGFFFDLCRRLNADAVAVAHTQNDVAETVLMRLIRGSGLRGLRAILPQRNMEGFKLIRPLLELTRKDVEDHANCCALKYCVDETNARTDYTRNKVRLELLPHLAKEYNPNITGTLVDLARSAAQDYDFLNQALLQRIKENVVCSEKKVKIKLVSLRREHPAMRRLLMRYAYE
ncbi:MAG: tRNA lysidine(34) synthetase TilS, partial [Candidatus Omnitrophica bacterium]|nr:tRNA lysidine(34) synthetase TilS [Candidatus Omnitrophota bacterium]